MVNEEDNFWTSEETRTFKHFTIPMYLSATIPRKFLVAVTHCFNMGVSDELAALRAKGTVKKNAADISSKSPRNLTLSTPEAEEAALRAKKERDKAKKVSAYGVGRYMWLGTYDELIVVLVFMVNRLWVE